MPTEQLLPIAFLSYSHIDDEDGKISRLCDKLAHEVHVQTGQYFSIFLDKNEIWWGENWRARIKEGLDSAAFLIVVITPSYFQSEECYKEYNIFLERERELEREDLILPIYFVESIEIKEPNKCIHPDWATNLSDRQYRNWVADGLRWVGETSVKYRREIETQALAIKKSLDEYQFVRVGAFTATAVLSKDSRDKKGSEISEEAERNTQDLLGDLIVRNDSEKPEKQPYSVWKRDNKEIIVDQSGGADYASITEALEVANPGDRVVIRPGRYRENLEITKRVELTGSGDIDEIVIESEAFTTIECGATSAVLTNLTIINSQEISRFTRDLIACIDNRAGELIIAACKMRGGDFVLHVHDTSKLYLLDCHVSRGSTYGIYVADTEEVSIVGTWIESCGKDGIFLRDCAKAIISHSRISDNLEYGIYCELGVLLEESENEFSFNAKGNIFKKLEEDDLPF